MPSFLDTLAQNQVVVTTDEQLSILFGESTLLGVNFLFSPKLFTVLDPCGEFTSNIASTLALNNVHVMTSDIRGNAQFIGDLLDPLHQEFLKTQCFDGIITSPPYTYAQDFIDAIEKVADGRPVFMKLPTCVTSPSLIHLCDLPPVAYAGYDRTFPLSESWFMLSPQQSPAL